MTTRTCSFGVTCKFDHPSWVPYGGIPNWKEVTGATTHNAPTTTDPGTLPQRTGEQNCAFYMKTGECKYGARCKFNHPMDRQTPVSDATVQNKDEGVPGVPNGAMAGSDATAAAVTVGSGSAGAVSGAFLTPVKIPASGEKVPGKSTPLNSKGLPLRQSETDCTYYIKTGSCKFGATCRFNHPEGIRPGARPVLSGVPPQSAPTSTAPTMTYTSAETHVQDGAVTTMTPPVKVEEYATTMNSVHPQRPGGPDCSYYLKTGECSFGATCKFHHPLNRQPTVSKAIPKLTLAGLPRREGEAACAYYMKTGSCKYGSTCRFDHPPPAEVAAKAAADASRTEAPSMLEAYDVHHPPGVPIQYVDLNPPPPPLPPLNPPPPPLPVSSIGSVSTPVKQEATTG